MRSSPGSKEKSPSTTRRTSGSPPNHGRRRADVAASLATTATEFEAQTKAALLRDEGIEARVTSGPRESAVWVAPGALERARALLEKRLGEAARIDWDSADLGERADRLPLHRPGRRPPLFWLGWALAAAIVTMLLGAALLAIVW